MSKKQTPELDIANPPPGFSLSEVADLLLQGHRPAHIKQRLLAEGVSNDNADEIVWCAFDHIVNDAAQMDCNTNKAWLVAAGRMVFRKQLDAAEKRLAGVDVLLEPGMDNEEGLPMMDIEEELDEEGNEVASSVNQTGKAAAEIVEVLRKASIQKAELEKKELTTTAGGGAVEVTMNGKKQITALNIDKDVVDPDEFTTDRVPGHPLFCPSWIEPSKRSPICSTLPGCIHPRHASLPQANPSELAFRWWSCPPVRLDQLM